jgi:outer membrane lipase/esterase
MNTTTFRRWLAAGLVACSSLLSTAAHAGPYSDLVIFGDSLSDTGNVFLVTGGLLPSQSAGPYDGGRYSNGPLWVETLAGGLGLPTAASPFLVGGSNYAFAGAKTGVGLTPPDLLLQSIFLWGSSHPVADANALYVIMAGGNDMRAARDAFQTNSAVDIAGRQTAAEAAIGNILVDLFYLQSKGAKNVLLANLPDLGGTPEAVSLGLQAASTDATLRFDAFFPALLAIGTQGLGLNMSFLDLAGLYQSVLVDATSNGGAVYGITNVTDPCAGFLGSAGNACATSLFSDNLHPSARTHELIGLAALQAVGAIPEPSTVLLFAVGLFGVIARSRRRA